MSGLRIGETDIADTFAEGFRMVFARLLVTAMNARWAGIAAAECCGYGTSVLGCDAECGIESLIPESETPDGRPGCSVLMFAFSADALAGAVANRVGQCLLTAPTTAVYDGWPGGRRVPLGDRLRFFGDGFQFSKLVGDERFWRIPVMDGEFVVAATAGIGDGVAGGNFLIEATDQASGLAAAERAVAAIAELPGAMTPFPGGVVRSGSKVGSRYRNLRASTADAWCPTLRQRTASQVHPEANCVYEIVIDGTDRPAVENAMSAGIRAAAGPGIPSIAAGNYGGRLGKHLFRLWDLPGLSQGAGAYP